MKKTLIFFILTTNIFLSFAQSNWKNLSTDAYKIDYPDNWEVNQSGLMGTEFYLFTALSGSDDKFRENINLMIHDLQVDDISLDDYIELTQKQIKTLLTNSKLIESKRLKNNGVEFHMLVYTARQGMFDLKVMQYFWLIDGKEYILTYTAEVKEFDKFFPDVEKSMNSFKILK